MPAETPDTPTPDQEDANDPMITTSLRLPQSVLDRVRVLATRDGVKPTALIRRWTEQACARELADVGPRPTIDVFPEPPIPIEVLVRQAVQEELKPLLDAVAGLAPPSS
ncbi:CopG family transcriptional regulator [Kutzneria buriramensis]|uniref:Uncharacterized protein n=1 Tax=Kutzneria buriramensis TaxID=1045776 RepID=A0A3E0I657_9PSEU|nr:CopG family transcriptional regulator [Kutzneria buriramensis]REH54212.1 hypothetical protein BCF44_102444 [Kutzneria buriramensis]